MNYMNIDKGDIFNNNNTELNMSHIEPSQAAKIAWKMAQNQTTFI